MRFSSDRRRAYLTAQRNMIELLLSLSLLLPPALATDREAEAPAKPSVLLIVSEDNGPELGCYGDPFARTPNLDRLAEQGVRFANAFVPYSVCSPSRASLFTGLVPHRNGQIGLATHRFAMYREWPNLVSLLHEAGYRTGIMGKIHVNPESSFPCDFRFNEREATTFNGRNVRRVAEAAAGFFEATGEAPFFLMVNYPDAHFPLLRQDSGLPAKPIGADEVRPLPWVGADSPRLREFTADYYNCLSRLDTGVGLLLDELEKAGRTENTLVIYLGDHGAQFSRGKTSVYDAGLRIPLILRWPDRRYAGVVREELVDTTDILPTVLAELGLGAPPELDGRPLQALFTGADVPWREYVFAMTTGSAPVLYYPQFSVRDVRYRLILSPVRGRENACATCYLTQHNVHFAAGTTEAEIAAASETVRVAYARYRNPPAVELYDLEKDPYEWHDLAEDPAHAEVRVRLERALGDWRAKTGDPWLDPAALERLTADHDSAPERNYRKAADFRWGYLDE